MKWGVRRGRDVISRKVATKKARRTADKDIRTKMKTKQISVKEGRAALLNNVHKSNQSSKTYNKKYDKRIKAGQSHLTAVRGATADTKAVNTMRMNVGSRAVIAAATVGAPIARRVYKSATSPEAIRAGKNIVQAAMRSNIRFVDGSKMTNVI